MLDKYISTPYRFNGREFSGADCYGLVLLYFRHELGIELLDFKYEFDNPEDAKLSNMFIENFHFEFEEVPLNEVKDGDIILMKFDGDIVNHCGIVVGGNRIMQISMMQGCTMTKLSRWTKFIDSAYRHKEVNRSGL